MNPQNPGIGWCDYTWNAAVGCKGPCSYCYARVVAKRLPCEKCQTFEPHTHPERLKQPYSMKKPARIFINSMWDFCRGGVSRNYKERILDVIRENPQHTFQVLTKRPREYRGYLPFPENLWLGTTVTGYDDIQRIYRLTDLPPKNIKFVSFEPLHGSIGLPLMLSNVFKSPQTVRRVLESVDWIIIGPQTGTDAKQPEKEWVEEILNAFDGPVFLKDTLKWPEKRQEFPY